MYGPNDNVRRCGGEALCPTIFINGDKVVVKGYNISDQHDKFDGLQDNESLVEIPKSLLDDAVKKFYN